jgi:hypothetical protein
VSWIRYTAAHNLWPPFNADPLAAILTRLRINRTIKVRPEVTLAQRAVGEHLERADPQGGTAEGAADRAITGSTARIFNE